VSGRGRPAWESVLAVPVAVPVRPLVEVEAERAEAERREARNARRRERRAEAAVERRYRRATRPADATAPVPEEPPVVAVPVPVPVGNVWCDGCGRPVGRGHRHPSLSGMRSMTAEEHEQWDRESRRSAVTDWFGVRW
jgi:NMD protein affecting ribosome stability and mRNA decay